MPYKKINDIKIYYELHGPNEGIPLVLFEGWGTALWMWFKQLPIFSKHYRVLIFDNRGCGKTSKPDKKYSIEIFASDAIELLNSLGIENSYILGISMGGYIAQQVAFTYPKHVKGLVLASTCFGGDPKSNTVQPSNKTLAKMFAVPTETLSLEQTIAIRRSTAWSNTFLENNRHLIRMMDEWMKENPQPEYARVRQAEAALTFNSEPYLHKIQAPTLILHGEKDLVVPSKNAELLLDRINNARLGIFKDAPHRIEVERSEQFNNVVLDFLKEVNKGIFKSEPKIKIIS